MISVFFPQNKLLAQHLKVKKMKSGELNHLAWPSTGDCLIFTYGRTAEECYTVQIYFY